MRIEDAQQGLVSMAPSQWLGVLLTASLSTMVSRDYKTLEARGLIVRHRLKYSDQQTSHLSLTPAGEAMARELLAADCGGVEASGFCITPALQQAGAEQEAHQGPVDV
jgi:DNA-binding MarR family transcriptional regulator